MNYPNITIQVRKFVLSLEYAIAAGDSKSMFILEPSLDSLLRQTADIVGYKWQTDTLEEIFDFIRTGEEDFMEFTTIDTATDGLTANEIIDGVIKAKSERIDEYPDAPIAVKEALEVFWQANMLASALEETYALVIAKAVFNASELGLNTIVLDDDQHEVRLLEKVGKEITAVPELELIVI